MNGIPKEAKRRMWVIRSLIIWVLLMGLVTAASERVSWWSNPVMEALTVWFSALIAGWLLHAWGSGSIFGPRIVRSVYGYQLLNKSGEPAGIGAGIFIDINELYSYTDAVSDFVDIDDLRIKIVRIQYPHGDDTLLCCTTILKGG